MRQIICITVALCLVFVLGSCTNVKDRIESPVNYYYRTSTVDFGTQSGIISSELREAKEHESDYVYLIEEYLNGPRSEDCVSPFPAGITLEEFEIDSNKIQVTLSTHLSLLSGSELMVACACLARTLWELTGVRTVRIGADGGLLNNEEYITLTEDNFAYWDDSVEVLLSR